MRKQIRMLLGALVLLGGFAVGIGGPAAAGQSSTTWPPCEYNPELPPHHPDCTPPVTPPCEYNPQIPADDENCTPPVTPPSVNPPSGPEVASRPPVPSTPEAVAPSSPQAAAPTAANPTAALPATGLDSTGVTALLALLITGLGGLAVMVARRRNATS